MIALSRWLPRLAARVPWVTLGEWPTPLAAVDVDGRPLWIKHEGASSPRYGGNKVRTLEVWFGHARARGARRIWSTGAYGSNHAVAAAMHAPAAGLEAGAIVFPQPATPWAAENCRALIAAGGPLVRVRSVVELPFVALAIARRERDAVVMPPGGATALGAFGALSAAFELAEQVAAGLAPPPRRIVVAIGSTCTTAGLLAGLSLAHAAGAWPWPVPLVHGVRVTPWPVTAHLRIADYARRVLARVAELGGPRVELGLAQLGARLVVDGAELGAGYGQPTPRGGSAAVALTAAHDHAGGHAPRLDAVYSAKAAAAALRLHRAGAGPLVFWATKSEAVMRPPAATDGDAPAALLEWLEP